MTPFQALYGRTPPAIMHYSTGTSPVHEVDKALETRDNILKQLKSHLQAAINRMKQIADSKRREVVYQEGDFVLLKLQPYRQHTAYKRAHHKLASKYFGPYRVKEKIASVAYKLELPEGARIHPVFHVSMLKKFVGEDTSVGFDLPPTNDEGEVRQAFLDLEGGHGFLVPNEVYEALIKVRFSLDLLLFIQSVRAYIRIRMEGSGWMVL
ncbi:PREDICTED: uncharacterized protein LOC104603871 [Nelumbo nucifera]|uniref:Uncharacterized protein LOC104603871 n=1 Tax=Nelumbo nucifera TaxID=4432 RepID=A0A1U8AGV1_NELNU|nr:PREDICTED: uncharacterized protein LOC104603871 [Nelumbo nucifera]